MLMSGNTRKAMMMTACICGALAFLGGCDTDDDVSTTNDTMTDRGRDFDTAATRDTTGTNPADTTSGTGRQGGITGSGDTSGTGGGG